NDQHDAIHWIRRSRSDQLRDMTSELGLTTKILYVPNIASTLVTALIQRHRTAPDGAASRLWRQGSCRSLTAAGPGGGKRVGAP
ncbi:hypothetical protein, partial [Streptomyces mirabilis]|uniref:hypothetical protein n=1 Tax=Streptomyces mirabilis TaxID=68239 RepID=UPI00371AD2B8